MSYDLEVYGRTAVSSEDAALIVASVDGLSPRLDPITGGLLSAEYQSSGEYCFTFEGPLRVDESDLPDVRFVAPLPDTLYRISVEGSRPESVSYAVTFAQELARRSDGQAIDPQNEEPQSQPQRRAARSTQKLHLHLSWFRPNDGGKELASDYLATAREEFPPAVPTRFGTHEPLQGSLADNGVNDAEFGQMYRDKCLAKELLFKGKSLRWGRITAWSQSFYLRYQQLWVTFDLAALQRMGRTDDVERFLVAVAERTGSYFAFAEVNATPLKTASSPHHVGAWSGLPERPQWLTWYSGGYEDMVLPHLTAGVTTRHARGISHRWTDEPSSGEELDVIVGRDTWLPSDLLAPADPQNHRKVLGPAATMPTQLNAL
ncbi:MULTISPECIES: hypothetical protein [Microbacterium]|uniref:Uncharacterized protein n=1 Tax=Microbacterium maritypicum MF109 TaxID=1333857 RepID=T5K5I1_MICMQ|nr:hypothetical protein [Microbacterium liquefaciens]EQM75679.1 hypothetical protein L687_01215 [Microbacterium maritypicum MF109]